MKRLLCIITLMLALVFALVACSATPTVEISEDGYWVINGEKTDTLAKGEQGPQGVQGEKGDKGDKGDQGEDGVIPTIEISADGYWVINGQKTSVKAKGQDGKDAEISQNLDENPQGLDFYLKDDGTYAVAVGNAKYLSKIKIPATYKGKAVTEIARNAFGGPDERFSSIVEIIIPNTIKKIDKSAFGSCDNLTDVYFTGSFEEWIEIEIIDYHNDDLKNATIHYNYVP